MKFPGPFGKLLILFFIFSLHVTAIGEIMAQLGKALISVSDKTGVETMAKGLVGLGADILSTGGTAKMLQDAGVSRSLKWRNYTGFPEIMNGRVKTLHPKIHGGLLGRRSVEAHMQQMKEQGISSPLML